MWQKILVLIVLSLMASPLYAQFQSDDFEPDNKEKVTFDELMQETITHINQRSSFIADDRGPASVAVPQPKMFPDILKRPTVVVEDFVVPQLDVPFSEFDKAPLGAGFTYNWQAPWSGF